MKKIWDYMRYSFITVEINLNPLQWWILTMYRDGHADMNPGLMFFIHIYVGPFRFKACIDDGSW